MARHRWRHLLVVAALGFVLAASVVVSSSLLLSSEAAMRDGVRTDHAGLSYSVQTGQPQPARILDAQEGMRPVRDEASQVSRGDLRVGTLLRTSRDPIPLGKRVSGRRPVSVDEVAVSAAVAKALRVGPGDQVTMERPDRPARDAEVVGVILNPGNINDRTVVTVDRSLEAIEATIWLTQSDPYANPALMRPLDLQVMNYLSVESVADQRAADLPSSATSIKLLPWGLGVLTGALILAALVALLTPAASDARALQAAGLSPAQAWRRILLLWQAALGAGQVLAVLLGLLVLHLTKDSVARMFDQSWSHIDVPVRAIAVVFGSTVLITWLTGRLARRTVGLQEGGVPQPATPRSTSDAGPAFYPLLIGTGLLIVVPIAMSVAPGEALPRWSALLAILASGLVPLVLARGAGLGLAPASRRVLGKMARRLVPYCAAVAVLTTVTATYSVRTFHDAQVAQEVTGSLQPPGALVVYQIPDGAAKTVIEEYRGPGGGSVSTYHLPDESVRQFRVTSARAVRCVASTKVRIYSQLPLTCVPREESHLNLVTLSEESDAVLAEPALARFGPVGLVVFKPLTDEVIETAEAAAQEGKGLGGNLPGLVLPRDHELVKRLGIRPGGTQLIVLHDFNQLKPVDQSRLRGSVARLAPTAQVQDLSDGDIYARNRSIATGAALGGGGLAFLALLLGGLVLGYGSRWVLQGLRDLGAGRRYRLGFVIRLAGVPLGAVAGSLLAVHVSCNLTGVADTSAAGLVWLIPACSAALALPMLLLAWWRVPAREMD